MKGRMHRLDFSILVPMLLLIGLGILTLYSAGKSGQTRIWLKQLLFYGVSFGLLLGIASRSPHQIFRKSLWIYSFGIFLLLLVAFTPLGLKLGAGEGAKRWLGTKALNFQPSELVRWTTLIFVADFLGRRMADQIKLPEITTAISAVLLPVAIVAKQPDLGMALSYLPILIVIPLIKGFNWKWLAAITIVIGISVPVAWKSNLIQQYQKNRIVDFLNPATNLKDKNYQTNQARIAIGAGRIFGQGLTGGTQTQLNYLPVKTTDFIFAAWAEERGFFGVLLALGLFGIFLNRILAVSRNAKTLTESYFCSGATAILGLNIIVNVAMVAGTLPNKGMVLPFFSYGGSSTISYFIGISVIMGIAYRSKVL
ncbi:MAG: rod shape-determining protein RodA [Holophagales bacterium]|jgi:rod shape determining protein RodA|nr:rod shape-determining protein RodA [Holophagales bacterium]